MPKATHFIGIDLHKTVVQVCVLDEHGKVNEEFRVRLGAEADGQEVLRRLARWQTTGRFVVEALGLNRWLVNACQQARFNMVVADAVKWKLLSEILRSQVLGLSSKRRMDNSDTVTLRL